jgi:molybdopterin-biosynthesis enzyme MoeA-like protein
MSDFNVGIYIIGDEILSGKREDKHLTQAIQILKARGLMLAWAEYLGDDPARMIASFKRSFNSTDIVFSFGGIGATPDDYTRQAAAYALDVPIVRHKEAVAEIEAQFGDGAYPKRVIMADFPRGAGLIPNPVIDTKRLKKIIDIRRIESLFRSESMALKNGARVRNFENNKLASYLLQLEILTDSQNSFRRS